MANGNRLKEHQDLARELKKRVSGDVRFDNVSRVLYSTDASIYQMDPVGVVMPRDADDVQAVVDIAAKYGVPILPRCGGTSLSGQAVNHALVLDFTKHMNGLVELNQEERWARVQPGLVLDQLNKQVAPIGYQFAPDPTTANRACIGGAIGNNTCGSHSVVYGKTIDHVLEIKTVLSDSSEALFKTMEGPDLEAKFNGEGLEARIYRSVNDIALRHTDEITARYPQIMRRVSGYNLDNFTTTHPSPFNMANLIVGSEGTLCVITEAKVKLVDIPPKKAVVVLHFDDMAQACEATVEILPHKPAAIELIGRMIIDRCREHLAYSRTLTFVEGSPDALLAVEFTGANDKEVTSKIESFTQDMSRKKLGYAAVNLSGAEQSDVWALRAAGVGLLMSTQGDSKPLPYVEDTAVDPHKLGEYVRRFDEVVKSHDTTAGYYGHASVGCLHIRPLVNLKTTQGINKMVSIASDISDLVLEFGGSLSGEHGDGIVRGAWTEKMFGPRIYNAFRQIKQAFDPPNLMNPGKIVDCPPMTENLRFGAEYQASSINTTLNFSGHMGFTGAVEMCNGMGACRKAGGTMCPSYMVTREEEHSTRGRANLLRAVLSGTMPQETLASKKLYDALDLCLECKGCKAECQTGVDMTKLKYEFTNQYYGKHRRPLRSHIFANINAINRIGARLAPLSNWAARNPVSKIALHFFLGIHAKRSLPAFTRRTFRKWFEARQLTTNVKEHSVVLLADTFTNYNYPETGIAAVEVLEKAGYNVILAETKCCGRPMLSKGLLDDAQSLARYNVDLLHSYAEQGIPIIGCEPSCLFTLKDEYPDLLPSGKVDRVAEKTFMIDEFLNGLSSTGLLNLAFTKQHRKVLFHGHCHQKALIGSQHSMALLRLPRNFTVEETSAGCCGMAGSFGYEREHYNLSMDVGAQHLFPAVEAKGDDWEIATMGVSCSQQIEHATNRKPRHFIEVFRDALD